MRVVIIEDEAPAINKLVKLLQKYSADIEVVVKLTSVKESVSWLKQYVQVTDLIFMDIRLSDGLSFEIFNQVEINKPVIFITAYNEYAIQAFKVNSIDYLLKPLKFQELSQSINKIESLRDNLPVADQVSYSDITRMFQQFQKNYKNRFLVRVGDHIRSIKTENIQMFYAEGRTVYIITTKTNSYIVDYTLEEIIKQLDPEVFFRANRSVIVNINNIKDVIVYSNSRLRILTDFDFDKEIIVSRDKVAQLKIWLEGIK